MRPAVIALVFVMGFISGQIAQAQKQEAPPLPAERVTGIGGIFIKAKDPKVLTAWYNDQLGVPRANGPMLTRLRAAGVTIEGKVVEDFNGKFGWVMDPEGNKIELWEPKPGF